LLPLLLSSSSLQTFRNLPTDSSRCSLVHDGSVRRQPILLLLCSRAMPTGADDGILLLSSRKVVRRMYSIVSLHPADYSPSLDCSFAYRPSFPFNHVLLSDPSAFGWSAATLEWLATWLLLWPEDGRMTKEDIKGVYDVSSSAFFSPFVCALSCSFSRLTSFVFCLCLLPYVHFRGSGLNLLPDRREAKNQGNCRQARSRRPSGADRSSEWSDKGQRDPSKEEGRSLSSICRLFFRFIYMLLIPIRSLSRSLP
jgi:hypothetical protein